MWLSGPPLSGEGPDMQGCPWADCPGTSWHPQVMQQPGPHSSLDGRKEKREGLGVGVGQPGLSSMGPAPAAGGPPPQQRTSSGCWAKILCSMSSPDTHRATRVGDGQTSQGVMV